MPKRTNEFQTVVRRIYQALAGTTASVAESVLLREKYGDAMREVDVLVTTSVAMHEIKVAIECRDHARDQDITWVDGLIGKYIDLNVQKIVAVSHTHFTRSAAEKAAQHNIELLTLKEAKDMDWASKIGPSAFRFYGFRNSPLLVVLMLNGVAQLKIEYAFEGEPKTETPSMLPYAQFFLELWHCRIADVAGQKLFEHVFSNWEQISLAPNSPRYAELVESYTAPRTLHIDSRASLSFDAVVWGIGTKYTSETLVPRKWSLGDKAAVMASAMDDQGKPVHITLVVDQRGQLLGTKVESTT